MAWLMSDGQVLASAEVAATRAQRRRGLLGRTHVEGALVLPRTRWVHTIGMKVPIDVAHLTADGTVARTTTMKRHRLGRPVRHSAMVIEASAGAFERWGVRPGTHIEVRE